MQKIEKNVNNVPLDKCRSFEECFQFLLENDFTNIRSTLSRKSNSVGDCLPHIGMKSAHDWLRQVLSYNVPRGKQFRGRLTELAYKGIAKDESEEILKLARILGWCVEILQASFLVLDDIMDNGKLRRGQPCWHLINNKGISAANDVFLLEHAAYRVLHKYFHHLPCYADLVDLCLSNTFYTAMGQSLDTGFNLKPGQSSSFENYSLELYNSIVTYKTSYYTCFLPVALAMCLAGIPRKAEPSLWDNVEKVTLIIGHYFQVQDDFLDCFGDYRDMGKVGSDIQEGKCTWLFVTAKELLMNGSPEQWIMLKQSYGKHEDNHVEIVKKVYKEVGLAKEFILYQEKACKNIVNSIRNLKHEGLENVLIYFFELIYNRSC